MLGSVVSEAAARMAPGLTGPAKMTKKERKGSKLRMKAEAATAKGKTGKAAKLTRKAEKVSPRQRPMMPHYESRGRKLGVLAGNARTIRAQ